jgi:hypothetical protein
LIVFRPDEIRKNVVITPARAAEVVAPSVVVLGNAAYINLRVD